MPDVYRYTHTVAPAEIDELGHANNAVYVNWMQLAAIAHSDAQGWPSQRYRATSHAWVARSHRIEYLRPAFAGDPVCIHTWVAAMARATCLRRYEMIRSTDKVTSARAETRWAYVNLDTLRPVRIPAEMLKDFVIVDRDTVTVE